MRVSLQRELILRDHERFADIDASYVLIATTMIYIMAQSATYSTNDFVLDDLERLDDVII